MERLETALTPTFRTIDSGPVLDVSFLFSSPVTVENRPPGQDAELVEFGEIGWRTELK